MQASRDVEVTTLQAKISRLVIDRDFGQVLRSVSLVQSRKMIDLDHERLSIRHPSELA